MLSNAYFLANFRFDTAENEPAKNLQNLIYFAKSLLEGRPGVPLRPQLRAGPGEGWLGVHAVLGPLGGGLRLAQLGIRTDFS